MGPPFLRGGETLEYSEPFTWHEHDKGFNGAALFTGRRVKMNVFSFGRKGRDFNGAALFTGRRDVPVSSQSAMIAATRCPLSAP